MLRQSMCSYQIMEIGRVPNAHLLSPNKLLVSELGYILLGFWLKDLHRNPQKNTGCLKNNRLLSKI